MKKDESQSCGGTSRWRWGEKKGEEKRRKKVVLEVQRRGRGEVGRRQFSEKK